MLTKDDAYQFAEHWLAAWNARDLEQIMAHYADEVTLSSPVAAQLLDDSQGRVAGRAALRAYFAKGLTAFPELHFTLIEVLWGLESVVLYYENQRGTHTAEYMELSSQGQVTRVVANYSR
jgi:hypothetical protein